MGSDTKTGRDTTEFPNMNFALLSIYVLFPLCTGQILEGKASWTKAIGSQFSSSLPGLFMELLNPKPLAERTVSLDPEADWQAAVEKNLARQNLYNNVIKEVFNSLTRIIGWTLISLALYGFSDANFFSRRK